MCEIIRDELPESFNSLTAAAEFWDTHSTVDYEHVMDAPQLVGGSNQTFNEEII